MLSITSHSLSVRHNKTQRHSQMQYIFTQIFKNKRESNHQSNQANKSNKEEAGRIVSVNSGTGSKQAGQVSRIQNTGEPGKTHWTVWQILNEAGWRWARNELIAGEARSETTVKLLCQMLNFYHQPFSTLTTVKALAPSGRTCPSFSFVLFPPTMSC